MRWEQTFLSLQNWHAWFDFNASNKLECHCHSIIISETQYLKRECQLTWCLTIFWNPLEFRMHHNSTFDHRLSEKLIDFFNFINHFALFILFLRFIDCIVFISIYLKLLPNYITWARLKMRQCFQALLCTKLHLCERVQCADSNRPSQSFESWCVQLFLFLYHFP